MSQPKSISSLISFLFVFLITFTIPAMILLSLKIEITNFSLFLFLLAYFGLTTCCIYVMISTFRTRKVNKQNVDSEERYKSLIDNNPDGIVIHEKGYILYANQVAISYLGYNENEIIGRHLTEFTHPKGHKKILERENKVYSSKEEIMFELTEYELIARDGSSFFVESKAISCTYNEKRCVQIVLRNITDRKKQEELLKEADKLVVVGQIAAGIAHEIRNPLTSIKGFMQMMRNTQPARETLYFDIIMEEIERINQVTNDFLILAKPQATNFRFSNIAKIVSDVITLLQPEASLHNVKCTFQCDTQNTLILCDSNELKQVFINTIKNSIEAQPNGGKVNIRLSENDQKIQINIQDEGIGISKDQIPNIGKPFYTLKEQGTGLGIMTSIKIVEKHNGTFQIDSEVGKGTLVTIEFPFDKNPAFT